MLEKILIKSHNLVEAKVIKDAHTRLRIDNEDIVAIHLHFLIRESGMEIMESS